MHNRTVENTTEKTIQLGGLGEYIVKPIPDGVEQIVPDIDNRLTSILFFDTCAILDIARDSENEHAWKRKAKDIEAFQEIISQSLKNKTVVVITAQVLREIRDNENMIMAGTKSSFGKLQRSVGHALEILKINHDESFENFKKAGESFPLEMRKNVSALLSKAICIQENSGIVCAAWKRVQEGRKPAGGNKQSMKDCVIIETYIEFNRQLKESINQFPNPIFISSNTNDYSELEGQLSQYGLKYAKSLKDAMPILMQRQGQWSKMRP